MLLATIVAASAFGQKKLQIFATELFPNESPSAHFPLLIEVQNVGDSTRGEVALQSPSGTIHYPVDLPSHSKKQFIAYPSILGLYEPLGVTLDTDSGTVHTEWDNHNFDQNGVQVLMIADQGGGLGYLRELTIGGSSVADVYGKPKVLPDRGIGYSSFSAVMLGPGSERMSDPAVQALKEYVLLGGTVAFYGGASPQILRDPRWQDIVPVQDVHTATIASLPINFRKYKENVAGPITVAVGKLSPGSILLSGTAELPVVVKKPFGTGCAMFFAADPFDSPFQDIGTRVSFFKSFLYLNQGRLAQQLLEMQALGSAFSGDSDVYYMGGAGRSTYHYYSGAATAGGGMVVSGPTTTYTSTPGGYVMSSSGPYSPWDQSSSKDPFHISLPPTATVFEILLAYVVLVVPINLLILRKLKRGELAWLTAPVISIGFAFIFFKFAAGLYSADLSKETMGLVVADSQSNEAYYLGHEQLFFPRGGGYDLKLHDVDFLGPHDEQPEYGYGGPRQRAAFSINPIDVGQILVPNLSANNLSFYEFDMGQKLPSTKWLAGNIRVSHKGLEGKITNESPYRLERISLYGFGEQGYVGKFLSPGQSAEIDPVPNNPGLSPRQRDYWANRPDSGDFSNDATMHVSIDRVVVSAVIDDLTPGTPLGRETMPNGVRLLETIHTGANP